MPMRAVDWFARPPMPPMHPMAETVAARVDIWLKPLKAARL